MIIITHITPPAQGGWPVALYCPICKETTIVLSQWATKPNDGDYWSMSKSCGSDIFGDAHNIKMWCDDNTRLALSRYFGFDVTDEKIKNIADRTPKYR